MTIIVGDCRDVLATLEADSIDAIVTDPPYALSFMSKTWDSFSGHHIDPAFLHWLAGFVDGEGCFSVHKKTSTGYETYDCQFSISLRADDRPILERIHRTLGIGTLSKPTAHRTGTDNPKARYSVSAKAELVVLRDIFRAYPLRAKKARDFELWSDALDLWLKHEPGEWAEMAAVRSRLMASREYVEEGVRIDPFQVWCWGWAREALRVLKPGGHLIAFGGTRTYHRLTSGLEDAGFEIRDQLAWLFGGGFPKSLDVGKQLDKQAGAEREIIAAGKPMGSLGVMHDDDWKSNPDYKITAPVTDAAKQWDGWGTGLKPAHEPIVLARKPLVSTVAANVAGHGTGALNIDACRIETTDALGGGAESGTRSDQKGNEGWARPWMEDEEMRDAHAVRVRENVVKAEALGRWPANVVLDEEAGELLDAQTGALVSGANPTRRGSDKFRDIYGDFAGQEQIEPARGVDRGGASRFFYCAKTSRAERNAGLQGFEDPGMSDDGDGSIQTPKLDRAAPRENWTPRPIKNNHPTVKPIALMRWLARLVTPPGGIILDPFTGSGTTGCASALEGFEFLGVELDPEYVRIAEARIAFWAEHGEEALRIVADAERAQVERGIRAESGQLDLFA